MLGVAEKPGPAQARALEQRYGRRNLFLLEGRARLTAAFIGFVRDHLSLPHSEPKLSLAIAAWAATHPVHVVETSVDVTDLGALAAPEDSVYPCDGDMAWAGLISPACVASQPRRTARESGVGGIPWRFDEQHPGTLRPRRSVR